MIDLGNETDGNNEICLGVHFALCIICKIYSLLLSALLSASGQDYLTATFR